MKSLILYASKNGSTKKAASILQELLGDESHLVDVAKADGIDLNSYDALVLGTPIRMGMADKRIRAFAESHLQVLKSKTTVLFITGLGADADENAKKSFSTTFLRLCRSIMYVGGELNIEQAKGFDRFVLKMAMKKTNSKNQEKLKIDEDSLQKLAEIIKT